VTTRRYYLLGFAAIALSLVIGLIVTAGWLTALDVPVIRRAALVAGQTPDWAIAHTLFVTSIGNASWRAILVGVVFAILIARRCRRSAAVFLIVSTLTIIGHSLAKMVFARARPDVVTPLDLVTNLSYPSGHASGTMVVLLLAALLIGRRWLVGLALSVAMLVGITRVLLGVHWPSDVVGGWLFGGGGALVGFAFTHRFRRAEMAGTSEVEN